MLPGLGKCRYEERLASLGSFPLEQRRLMRDLMDVYTIIRGSNSVDWITLIALSENSRTGVTYIQDK